MKSISRPKFARQKESCQGIEEEMVEMQKLSARIYREKCIANVTK